MISGEEVEKIFKGERAFIPNPIYMYIEKKRKNYELYQILILLKNVPGSTVELMKYFENKGYNIIAMRAYVLDDVAVFTGFIEATKSTCKPIDELKDNVLRMEHILDVKAIKLTKTGQFDAFHFPLVFKDTRIMAITDAVFYELRKQILNTLGSGGAVILYAAGVKAGSALFDQLLSDLESIEDQLIVVQDMFRAFGWGIIEIKGFNLTLREGEVIIEENIEAQEVNMFECHFIRGVLTGIIRRTFRDNSIQIKETHCRSMGDKYCRFIIS